MSNPPGVPSALGIDAVEWFTEGGENLTVQVTGRWRRRRQPLRGQPVLVIEAQGMRHRFAALPELPSVTGAPPGVWRISFSVPAWLAPHLGGRIWLQLGGVIVPLPAPQPTPPQGAAVPLPAPQPTPPQGAAAASGAVEPPSPDTLVERRLRSAELAVQAARREVADREAAAAELAARIELLEAELHEARLEPARLLERLKLSERNRRAAEQRAHAESALRIELEEELAARDRGRGFELPAIAAELAESEDRIRALEQELEQLRRRSDEAEQLAAAARAVRARTQQHPGPRDLRREFELAAAPTVLAPGPASISAPLQRSAAPGALDLELALVALRAAQRPGGAAGAAGAGGVSGAGGAAGGAGAGGVSGAGGAAVAAEDLELPGSLLQETVVALRRELDVRTATEVQLRGLLASAQARLEASSLPETPLERTLAGLRNELARLRAVAEHETARRAAAESLVAELERRLLDQAARSARVYAAIEELRHDLEAVRTGAAIDVPSAASPIEAERLTQALARLRESTPARESEEGGVDVGSPVPTGVGGSAEFGGTPVPGGSAAVGGAPRGVEGSAAVEGAVPGAPAPARTTKPWLRGVFKALTARDPTAAGRLLLDLLPAQAVVHPQPVAYDLILTELPSVQFTLEGDRLRINHPASPRKRAEVDFQVTGDLASLARLVAAGPLRRRLRRGVARLEGDRSSLQALTSLVRTPLSLDELHAAGVRLEPLTAFTVVSLMIEPRWTAGERFTIAHQSSGAELAGAYLHVRDGEPLSVTAAPPLGPVATTIVCPDDALLPLLAHAARPDASLRGEPRPLSLLWQWLDLAQSG